MLHVHVHAHVHVHVVACACACSGMYATKGLLKSQFIEVKYVTCTEVKYVTTEVKYVTNADA